MAVSASRATAATACCAHRPHGAALPATGTVAAATGLSWRATRQRPRLQLALPPASLPTAGPLVTTSPGDRRAGRRVPTAQARWRVLSHGSTTVRRLAGRAPDAKPKGPRGNAAAGSPPPGQRLRGACRPGTGRARAAGHCQWQSPWLSGVAVADYRWQSRFKWQPSFL